MPEETDPIVIPVPGEDLKVNDQDFGMLKMQLHGAMNAAAQRRMDGSDHYAENLRYDYLEGKNTTSFAEGTGQRLVTESGAGRTRVEANSPASTQTVGGQ